MSIAFIKSFIDRTTMYRLVLYYLLVLFIVALVYGALGILPYAPLALLWSIVVLLSMSWITNEFFAWAFDAVTNSESVYITPLILVLILAPVAFTDVTGTIALALSAVWAMASKYLITIEHKHVFNPAALAVVLSGLLLGVPATWWVAGNLPLLPIILIGGIMVVHKLRKADLVIACMSVAFITVALTSQNPIAGIQATFLHSALLFLAFVMLTEPLTMPPTRVLRIMYGALVGVLFAPAVHLGTFYFSPELALLVGNLFSSVVSPKGRFTLSFVERRLLARGMYEYLFKTNYPLRFSSGQYLEWTLGNVAVDTRGNRRFFTIASAPEDPLLALGVRFYDKPSAFKQQLAALPVGGVVSASSLGGDFTLPKDTKRKVAFLAGGIGVTPFASMARHCVATGDIRDVVLLYANKLAAEIAYRDIFTRVSTLGWRVVYVLSDEEVPDTRHGHIDSERIKREIPDYTERLFYISGSPGMVNAMKRALLTLGVSRFSIKTDFFPGLA